MASAYKQFSMRCIEKVIGGAAVGLAGTASMLGDVELGPLTITQSPWFGATILSMGLLYATSGVVALRNRPKPLVRT